MVNAEYNKNILTKKMLFEAGTRRYSADKNEEKKLCKITGDFLAK